MIQWPTRLVLLAVVTLLGGCRLPLANDEPDTGSLSASGTFLVNFDAKLNRLTRTDLAGDGLDAHGGEIARFGDTYYLYGETYGCGFEWLTPGTPFCGFRVYSSPNLADWTDRGLLFDVSAEVPWQARCKGRTNGCFRPHVVHNARTGRYVLWINGYDAPGGFYVLESASPIGPFEDRPHPRLATAADAFNGDHDLFVDDDSTAYVVYTDWRRQGDIVVEQLSRDYLSGTGLTVLLGVKNVEAPSMFKRGSRYYVTMSDPKCGYCTTGTSYAWAPTPLGPWSGTKTISTNSCGGQPKHVSELPAKDGGSWYLYQSDLWNQGERNQGTADQFWAPLSFDPSGAILPIRCEPRHDAPVLSASETSGLTSPGPFRLQCDIGAQRGRVQREVRFLQTRDQRLRSFSFMTFQKGRPLDPLILELRSLSDGGSVLHREQIQPAAVSWGARRVTVMTDTELGAGRRYAVRAYAKLQDGCYGSAYRDDLPGDGSEAYISDDGGIGWTLQRGRTSGLFLSFDGD